MPAFFVVAFFVALLSASASSASSDDLTKAARKGDLGAVEQLLAAGADPNQGDDAGVTALHIAATEGRVDVVRALLVAGASVDQMEFDGDTPLLNAAVSGHEEVVSLLLSFGADTSVKSSRGYTPIQHARRARHSRVVRVLRDAAKRPTGSRPSGKSPGPPRASGNTPSQAPQPPAERIYRPGYTRRIAAVIGVDAYDQWPPLSGARRDAEKIAAKLRSLGFDEVLESYDADATRAGVLDLLGRQLSAIVGENDLVVIFFAGHGQTETIEGGQKRGYIVPVDASVRGVFSTAIPMSKLRELSDRLPAKHVYYAMDSCYSGLGLTRGLGIVKPGAKDYFGKVTSLRSVQMVTAGGEGEEAIEEGGEGIFTRSLLAALDGVADANGDGIVTATEIGAYVAPRVTNETQARQSPQAGRLEGEGEIAFELPR